MVQTNVTIETCENQHFLISFYSPPKSNELTKCIHYCPHYFIIALDYKWAFSGDFIDVRRSSTHHAYAVLHTELTHCV